MPQLDDSRITARPGREAFADLGEQLVRDVLVLEAALDEAPRMEVAAPREGDEPLRERAELFRLRHGGLDAAVQEQARRHIVQRRLLVARRARELAAFGAVTHLLVLAARQLRLRDHTGVENANLALRLFEPHPEVQALAAEQLRDLAQRLFAHVLYLEQVLFLILDEVGEGADVGVDRK